MAVDDTQFQGEQMLRERMAVIQKARDMELLAREKIERELRHNEAAMVNDIATQKKIWEKEDEFEDVGDVELAANVKREREEALSKRREKRRKGRGGGPHRGRLKTSFFLLKL